MKRIINRFHLYIKEKQKERQAIKTILRLPELGITFVKDTSITLGCVSTGFNSDKNPVLYWKNVEIFTKKKDGDLKAFIRNVYKESNKKKIPPSQYFDELLLFIPKIDGKFWKAVNKSGKELRWINQTPSNKLGVKISKLIDDAISSSKTNVSFEGKVARFVESHENRLGKIDNFANKVINNKKTPIAEFDITTSKYLIECKQSISLKTVTRSGRKEEFLSQFFRYTDPNNINYINFQNKKVILVIDELTGGLKQSNPIFKEIENMGVTILTNYKQLKNLK